MNNVVKQGGHTDIQHCCAAADGRYYAFLNAFAEALEHFFTGKFAFLKEFLHQLFIRLSRSFCERFIVFLGFRFKIAGNGYLFLALAVKFSGGHAGKINIADERAAFHYRKLYRHDRRAEFRVNVLHHLDEVSVFTIHLIDDHHTGFARFLAHIHGFFRADGNA